MPNHIEQLLAITRTGEFEDNGGMRVVSVHWSADRVTVRFQVDHGTGKNSAWELRCAGVLEYLFADVSNCGLNLRHGNHPAVDQYLRGHEFLHFSSAPVDSLRAVGKLWAAHVNVADDWIPFDKYLNRELPLLELLASGSGLLATGPQFLIAAYADVLETEGCRPARKALAKSQSVTHATLVHFGESFLVAQDVLAKPVDV